MDTYFTYCTTEELKRKLSAFEQDIIPKHKYVDKVIYVAGPWFDDKAEMLLNTVKNICAFSNRNEYYYPDEQEVTDNPEDAFKSNVENVRRCDVVLALVDRKDVGTAWEIGMAYALGKKIVLVGLNNSTFKGSKTNLMLAYTGECVLLEDLYEYLQTGNGTFNITKTWEEIE